MFNNARHVFSIRPRHSHAVFNGSAKYINSGFRRKNAFVKAGASTYMFTLSHARQEWGSKMEYLLSRHTARWGRSVWQVLLCALYKKVQEKELKIESHSVDTCGALMWRRLCNNIVKESNTRSIVHDTRVMRALENVVINRWRSSSNVSEPNGAPDLSYTTIPSSMDVIESKLIITDIWSQWTLKILLQFVFGLIYGCSNSPEYKPVNNISVNILFLPILYTYSVHVRVRNLSEK